MTSTGQLVGSVFERKPTARPSNPDVSVSAKTGFPAVQHRSTSAFARNREQLRSSGLAATGRTSNVPVVVSSKRAPDQDDLRRQISDENQRKLEGMTDAEREDERNEILERFGPGVVDLFKRAREAKEKRAVAEATTSSSLVEIPVTTDHERPTIFRRGTTPPPALSTSPTRPSSRADRKLRFAELTPDDVHVYESAPPSPRKKALALPPPEPSDDTAISLGQWKGKGAVQPEPEAEEGTPEDIRRRFFPNVPAHDPNIAWIETPSLPATDGSQSLLRFDLTGTPIPPSLASSLPTHLGLHHHAEGSLAGYTLDDIFLLSRSSVPAQRTTMLGVLARIANRLGKRRCKEEGMAELDGKEEELRKRIVAAGIEALSERGSLGARAVEAIWECIVGWDEDLIDVEGVELEHGNEQAISSLPLEFILPQMATTFSLAALPTESLAQLLAILHRLAQHSNTIATTIVTTPNLIASVIQIFLLTPIPPTDTSPLPDPAALQLLTTLALASRSNAATLIEPADALLRFITMLSSSPYSPSLSTALVTSTLRFYTVLASYGFYSHIATTATDYFMNVSSHVLAPGETRSRKLMCAWAGLLESWMVCAIDPHQTTPSHEILWSQVVGWGWGDDLLELRQKLSVDEQDWEVWAALWRAEAAWLEGARINGVRSGENERSKTIEAIRVGFENGGKEHAIILGVLAALRHDLGDLRSTGFAEDKTRCVRGSAKGTAMYATVLASAIRFWLSCLPSASEAALAAPPFSLPFSQVSELSAQLVNHPLWATLYSPGTPEHAHVYCRPLTALLVAYLHLSRRLPSTTDDLWMAQVYCVLPRLLPGDEAAGLLVLEDSTGSTTKQFVTSRGWRVPPVLWEKGGMAVLTPFLTHALRPTEEVYIGPLWASPSSIMASTTLRLPSGYAIRTATGRSTGLPLQRDWMLSPLDHLLRSGDSAVFKALPVSWDASETEVVRAALFLTKVAQEVLRRFSLTEFVLTREEVVFGCMKVFMLEHGQQQNDSAGEVFRDSIVGQFMEDLIAPYTVGVSATAPLMPAHGDLETVAMRFLGPSTPFYQYYTDFVALYDAISFAHPLFGRLLLPPLAMHYAPDYRKHLWNDFAHVLRTLRAPLAQTVADGLAEFLWPAERDAQLIAHYLRALASGVLDGLVRLIALHHVACQVWPDLGEGEGTDAGAEVGADGRAEKVFRALVGQARPDVVREVVRYRQVREGSVAVPPTCFEGGGEWQAARLAILARWGGEAWRARFAVLLEEP